jgi:predicted nucleotidyltransferase
MIPELQTQRDAIAELCRRFGVLRLDVFGSAVTGGFDDEPSDVDLLVDFDPHSTRSRFDAYFGLKEGLEDLFGRPVDLVAPSALGDPHFAELVARSRLDLYAT